MEVSPVPSPFPGTNSGPTLLWSDSFAYSNGALTGRGAWGADDNGDGSTLVTSGQVVANLAFTTGNANAAAGALIDLAAPFTMGIVFQFVGAVTDGCKVQIQLGDFNTVGALFGFQMIRPGDPANTFTWEYFDTGGGSDGASGVAFTQASPVTMEMRAAGGFLRLYVNGAAVGPAQAFDVTTVSSPNYQFTVLQDTDVGGFVVTRAYILQ